MRDDILFNARRQGREQSAVLQDFANRLFPRSSRHFSDRMIAFARTSHIALVGAIEEQLVDCAISDHGAPEKALPTVAGPGEAQCLRLLDRSGLADDREYVAFLHARSIEADLDSAQQRRAGKDRQFIGFENMLDDPDAAISDAAMGLLIALHDWRERSSAMTLSAADLPAEIMYLITWRIAAALSVLAPGQKKAWTSAAETVLRRHDESALLQARAAQLAQARQAAGRDSLAVPDDGGAPLFLAELALLSGVGYDNLLHFLGDGPSGRFPVVLRALSCDAQSAATAIEQLIGGSEYLSLSAYDAVDAADAREMLAGWNDETPMRDAIQRMQAADPD